MLQRLGERFSRFALRWVPDPFVLAVLLTLVAFAVALVHLDFDVGGLLTAWIEGRGNGQGFWNLLTFGMQMCLILVTGHALAESPPMRRVLNGLADRANTPGRAVAVVAVTAMVLALVNWGLGLIGGALLARKVGERARAKGIAIHYPLVAAAGYTGLLVWHGGLSASAPLKVTTTKDLVEVLGDTTGTLIGSIPLSETIAAPGNLIVNAVLLLLVPWVLVRMIPASADKRVAPPASIDVAPDGNRARKAAKSSQPSPKAPPTPAEKLERSWVLVVILVIAGLSALVLAVDRRGGLGNIGLNLINFAFLFLGLALHGSARSYVKAIEDGARGCAGIILQFPFYAGIMGVLAGTGLLEVMATAVARVGAELLPAIGFYLAGLVNLFVPSGGGQWAVQGPLLVEAGLQTGVEPSKMVMALAYGDQWTNMLQPFWALPLLAITGVRARDIIGYTAVLLVLSQVVFLVGLYLPF